MTVWGRLLACPGRIWAGWKPTPPGSIPRRFYWLLLGEQIADLAQHLDILGNCRWWRIFLCFQAFPSHLNHLDHRKNTDRHDDKVDDIREECAICENGEARFLNRLDRGCFVDFSFSDSLGELALGKQPDVHELEVEVADDLAEWRHED